MAKLTWDDVEERLEYLNYKVLDRQSNGTIYQIEIEKYSDAGQDCVHVLQCEKNNPASVARAFDDLYQSYDPDKETMLWTGPDGHGKNGAPYRLSDVLKDMEGVEKDLENSAAYMKTFVENFDVMLSKDDVKGKFLTELIRINGGKARIEEKYAIVLCKQAADFIINKETGSPKQKKEFLNEYLREVGITDSNPKTYADVLNKAIRENQKTLEIEEMKAACKNHTLHTTKPGMSSTEAKYHNMFDHLFNCSDTNPVEYAQFVLDASSGALLNGKKGEKFWEYSVDHAVNSGGELWQPSVERIFLMERFGLIHNDYEEPSLYGSCYDAYKAYMKENAAHGDTVSLIEFIDEIFPNKTDMTEYLQKTPALLKEYKSFDEKKETYLVEKYSDTADKMYGKYMHQYLKNLDVLDNSARDRKIAQYEKNLDSGRSR